MQNHKTYARHTYLIFLMGVVAGACPDVYGQEAA
jgi:hypothetical protein